MFTGPDKRKEKTKTALLRGVYQQNLKIIGKKEKIPFHVTARPYIQKSLFLIALSVSILIFNYQYLDPAFKGESLTVALSTLQSMNSMKQNTPTEASTINLMEIGSFLTDSTSSIPISELFDLKVRSIVIDPGHGGDDPGAIGKRGTLEKSITLDIARRLRDRLKRYSNYQVYMTRDDDRTISLSDRIVFANKHSADLYVSIHVNYLPYKPISIIETYYFGPYYDQETLKLSELENKGSKYTLADFKNIAHKIGNTIKFQEAKTLATSIQKSLFQNISRDNTEVLDYGIKTAPFVVLLGVDMPSVLAEVSCLSNTEDEEKLNNDQYRNSIAYFLEEGILDYLNNRLQIEKGDTVYEAKRAK